MASSNPMETASSSGGQPMSDIEKPHNNDCLCGRGVTTNKWPGNEQFRSLVALNKELYVTSTKRQKMAISRSIVEAVRTMNPPGRFLERNAETGLWNDIGDRKATEKTSQALRDGAAALRKQLSEDLGDPDFLSAVFDMDTTTDSSKSEPAPKPKEKPVKAKPLKKSHRRTQSMPDTIPGFLKKATNTAKRTAQAPVSPRPSVRRTSQGTFSYPNSPCTTPPFGESPFHNSSTPPPAPLGETGYFYGERPSDLPPRTGTWNGGPTHRRRHTSCYPGNALRFPPPVAPRSPSPSHHSFSGGYWNRPPMSPVGRWSPSSMLTMSPDRTKSSSRFPGRTLSPMSFRAFANADHADPSLAMPALPKSATPPPHHPPLSPLRSHSPKYPTPPVSPCEFNPPLSPRSSDKRQNQVVLTAKTPAEEESSKGTTSPTDVVSTNDTTLQENNNKSSEKAAAEVALSDSRCESPLHGDKIDTMYSEDANPAEEEEESGMNDPIPFDAYNSNDLMEISDDLLRLPIASVGHLDEISMQQ